MAQSNWHLRIAITSTAALMSVAAALIIPQLGSPNEALPEILVPFHSSAPTTQIDIVCGDLAEQQESEWVNVLDTDLHLPVEIYSRDEATVLPEVRLDPLEQQNCVSPVSPLKNTHLEANTDHAALGFICEQADAVAYKAEY